MIARAWWLLLLGCSYGQLLLQAEQAECHGSECWLNQQVSFKHPRFGISANQLHITFNEAHSQWIGLEAYNAAVTLCNCQQGELPDWQLHTSHVWTQDAKRLRLEGAQLQIKIGQSMWPITPRLWPIEWSLQKQAHRPSPLKIHFYQGFWPQIDYNFWYPFEQGGDITLSFGIRTDWHTSSPGHQPWLALGAPRLRVAGHYLLAGGGGGKVTGLLIWDGANVGLQQWLAAQSNFATPVVFPSPAMPWRGELQWHHQSQGEWHGHWDTLVEGRWLSDNLLLRQFATSDAGRFVQYVPSRARLQWEDDGASVVVVGDILQRLNRVGVEHTSKGDVWQPVWLNGFTGERHTLHRLPYVAWQLLPQPLFTRRLQVSGDIYASRYHTFTNNAAWLPLDTRTAYAPAQDVLGSRAELRWSPVWGPMFLQASLGVDGLWAQNRLPALWEGAQHEVSIAALAQAQASMRLWKDYGLWQHSVEPMLRYQSLPYLWQQQNFVLPPPAGLLHAPMRRRVVQQLALQVQQRWFQPIANYRVDWLMGWPFDLYTGQPLQMQWDIRMEAQSGLQIQARSIVNFRSHLDAAMRWPEVLLTAAWPIEFARASLVYQRYSPNAPSLQQSLYEITAPSGLPLLADSAATPEGSISTWSHTAMPGISVQPWRRLEIGYEAMVQLPRPGEQGNLACSSTNDPDNSHTWACVVAHRLHVRMRSQQNCWRWRLGMYWVPQQGLSGLRTDFGFDLGS